MVSRALWSAFSRVASLSKKAGAWPTVPGLNRQQPSRWRTSSMRTPSAVPSTWLGAFQSSGRPVPRLLIHGADIAHGLLAEKPGVLAVRLANPFEDEPPGLVGVPGIRRAVGLIGHFLHEEPAAPLHDKRELLGQEGPLLAAL